MSYQSKTTLMTISVGKWTEETDTSLSMRFTAAHGVALQIASLCQMDIMNLIPYSLAEKGEECRATVVYMNNGISLDKIRTLVRPVIGNKPNSYYMILDLYEWQGTLECLVCVRGTNEEWD